MAADEVEVVFGQAPSTEAYIKIAEPVAGAVLDVAEPIRVSGTGGGLHEGPLAGQLHLVQLGHRVAVEPREGLDGGGGLAGDLLFGPHHATPARGHRGWRAFRSAEGWLHDAAKPLVEQYKQKTVA